MDRKVVNPGTWQDAFGFVQGNAMTSIERVVLCAGQLSVDGEGQLLHPGDMKGQISQSLDNLELVLKGAGMELSDVVKMNYYTTDIDAYIAARETLGRRLSEGNCRPASTLLGISRLGVPGALVEIEAIAVA